MQAPFANADHVPKCFGQAFEHCECSALFSVLETEDTDEGRRQTEEWRLLSDKLRSWSYTVMGKKLADQLIDARVAEWRTASSAIDTHQEFAQVLSSCARFWDGSLSDFPVSIGP
ncbi:hypothetical protein [Leisingera caerulea]|uniref:Uncharacterized protein n=1 Tax=Leisingera caerulea TaxID=506591 RepID=A0A9Q9M2A5_LEICA|nr:hypothetical protein [Leisingera caerulea]UWQ55462.1 hypothetical protein K3721_07960 [Leisingera caerulea]